MSLLQGHIRFFSFLFLLTLSNVPFLNGGKKELEQNAKLKQVQVVYSDTLGYKKEEAKAKAQALIDMLNEKRKKSFSGLKRDRRQALVVGSLMRDKKTLYPATTNLMVALYGPYF